MISGDKVQIKNHPDLKGEHIIEEYNMQGRIYYHVNKIPLTSPDGEPWNIVCLIRGENGVNTYEATWRREVSKSDGTYEL